MAFSGGVYTLPTPALVPGQTVSSSENNTVRNDMAASFNLTMLRNGTSTATANLPMGGYKLTGLGAATTNGDALSYGAAAVVSNLTDTALTAGRVNYNSTGGLLTDSANLTFDGTTLTAAGLATGGNIAAATASISGNITVTGGTANGVTYLNGSKVLTSGSALTFDGSILNIGGSGRLQTLTSTGDFTSTGSAYIRWYDSVGAKGYIGHVGTANTFQIATAGSGFNLDLQASGSIIFEANNTEQMRLTSTGLGIGTSSPGSKLDVRGSGGGQLFIDYSASGVNYYNATNHIFQNNAGAAERMRLDSSGNLGLGVTPSAWSSITALEMANGTALGSYSAGAIPNMYLGTNCYYDGSWKYKVSSYRATRYLQSSGGEHQWLNSASGTAGNAISFTQAMTLDASGRLLVGQSSTSYGTAGYGDLEVNGSTGSLLGLNVNGGAGAYLQSNGNLNIYNALAGYTAFGTNNTERMRIDSSGNLLVGATSASPVCRVFIQGADTGSTNYALRAQDSGTFNLFQVRNDGQIVTGTRTTSPYNNTSGSAANMYVDSSGILYRSTSSLKYKTDVKDAEHGLADLLQLRSVTYKSKTDGETVFGGLIAEEVDAAGLTEFVQYADDGTPDALAYGNMVSLCIKAIQELKAELDATKAEVAALKGA